VPNKSLADIQQAMQQLQENFLRKLETHADILRGINKQLQNEDISSLNELINLSHQLAGSCGTFQLADAGYLARQLEVVAIQLQQSASVDTRLIHLVSDAISHFTDEVDLRLLKNNSVASMSEIGTPYQQKQLIWLALEDQILCTELMAQLSAFGYQVVSFDSFGAVQIALLKSVPGLLFCSAELKGESLLLQNQLLQYVSEQQCKLMIFSIEDFFELRVAAVRINAAGFFVSPLDVPSILHRISKLFDDSYITDKKVAILDDDLLLAEHYSWVLKSAGIDVLLVKEPEQIISELQNFSPDLLLLDMHMPGYSGSDISGVIRQYDSLSSLHITFLSAEHDIKQQLQAMSFGADDFITKPISNENLITSVRLTLARNKEIKSLIERDSLTGLIKHSAIKEAVARQYDLFKRSTDQFCVAMLDLDHFKNINDSYGHAMGDVVISTIATLLKKRLRRSDRAGRYGGEEFLIVLPNCKLQHAEEALNTILRAFREIHFSAGKSQFSCTFSAGVISSELEYADAEDMIKAADEALYQAKKLGRNQIFSN
jgi:diguanylate cyclase (GGDEF)-like protein